MPTEPLTIEEEFGDRARIVVDPDIYSGKPTIRGTRSMVSNILGMFSGDYSINRILKSYPELSRPDVISAVEYASRVVDGEKMLPKVEHLARLRVLLDENI